MNTPDNFPYHMEASTAFMNKGDFKQAIASVKEAEVTARSNTERAQAQQLLGICYRLKGDSRRSTEALLWARTLAEGDRVLSARINRDLAMTYMEALSPGDTEKYYDIMEMLHLAGRTLVDDPNEYWVTSGYMGRAELLFGKTRIANGYLFEAYRELSALVKGNETYELNTLIWLMRTEGLWQRLKYFPKATKLVRSTGQRRRLKEVVVITIGGNTFYGFVRRITGK